MAKKPKSPDYEVGYKKPPKHTRFKKDESGNPPGRPRKRKKEPVDVAALLSEPVTVMQDGEIRKIPPFEGILRALVRRALNEESVAAAIKFLRYCEHYKVIRPAPVSRGGGILVLPNAWDRDEWFAMLAKNGPPPWPGPRSGLPDDPNGNAGGKDKT